MSGERQMPRVRIGAVWIDALTFEGALDRIVALRAANGGMVVTPNVDHIVTCETNEAAREAYSAASVTLADGRWVVWAARLLGTPLPAKISGSDLLLPLARRAAKNGQSMFLLGGAPGAGEKAAERLV